MATVTLNVRGIKLRTQTQRRFVAVMVRPEDTLVDHADGSTSVYVKCAYVQKRSDNLEVIETYIRRQRLDMSTGLRWCVFDTTTGEEL
jgi:hypothetical protein